MQCRDYLFLSHRRHQINEAHKLLSKFEWEIKENKKNFIIRKKDETLNIYKQRMKEKTEKKIEYAKSFFGNFQDRVYRVHYLILTEGKIFGVEKIHI